MKIQSKLLALGAAVVIGAGSFAFYQQTNGSTVFDAEYYSFSPITGSSTQQERTDLNTALLTGATPDPMWVETDFAYSVKGVDTGVTKITTGEKLHVVTIIDDSNELVTAKAYIDGNLVNTATVANGGITSNGDGTSTATLNVWLLASGTHTYLATWEDANGTGKEESITTP